MSIGPMQLVFVGFDGDVLESTVIDEIFVASWSGDIKLVDMLVKTGRSPEAGLLHYKWYNTPNIRYLTLDDFSEFCDAKNITVHERIALNTETNAKISDDDDPNRNADMAIFVLSR